MDAKTLEQGYIAEQARQYIAEKAKTASTTLSSQELEAQYEEKFSKQYQELLPKLRSLLKDVPVLNPDGFQPAPRQPSSMEQFMGKYVAPTIEEDYPHLPQALDYLTMPGDYLKGALSGKPGERIDPYEFTGANEPDMSHLQAAIRGGAGMMVDPLIAVGPLAGGIVRGLRGLRAAPSIPPVADAMGGEVDPELAARITPNVTGTPDYPLPGARTTETGRTLTVPALDPGSMTNEVGARSARTGRPLVGKVPGLSPGEFGPEVDIPYNLETPIPGENTTGTQTLLLPEQPSGMAPTGGKRILQPGEQLAAGEVPLRPQVYRQPGLPESPSIPNPLNQEGKGIEPDKIDYPGLSPTAQAVQPITNALQGLAKRGAWKEKLWEDQFAPQKDYRLTLQTSPRGSVSVREAEKDAGLAYLRDPLIPPDAPLVFPGWPSRITQGTIDTLRKMGPSAANIGNSIDSVLSNRAILSSNNLINLMESLKPIVAKRGRPSRIIEGFRELTDGENAFVWGTHRYFDLTEKEVEEAVNYLYTGGRMIPTSTKARAVADKVYEHLLYDPSVAAHEVGLDTYNPLTGKHEPFGAPHKFFPQIPVHPTALQGVSDTHLELLYAKQGGMEGTNKSFPLWKAQLKRQMSQGGELREAHIPGGEMNDAAVTYDMASKRYKGLEVSRLLDLEALGGSPYQWLKIFGYETDLIRGTFKFNSSAHLRTEWARAMPQIEKDMAHVAEHSGTDLTEWVALAVNRAQGINTGLTETSLVRNLVKGLRDFNNATLLQFGGIGSAPQLGYAITRAPIGKSLLGAIDFVTGNNREILEKSGALYPTAMNLMMQPEGPLAVVSSGAIKMYGVNISDKWSRGLGGLVGIHYTDFLEKALLKYPNKERIHKLIEEMGGNPGAILKNGSIPEPMKLAMIQKYANYAAGVPDVRGLPLIATNQTAYWRLANQYRIFLFNNQAEMVRLWKQAPTTQDAITRITKLVAGTGTLAAGSGSIIEYIRNAFTEDKEGSPFVNKRLKKIVGNEGAAFAIQTLTYGLGALYGSLILTALDNQWKLVANLAGGPTAGLVAGAAEDLVDSITYGPNWKSLRTTSRRIPFLGPAAQSFVHDQIQEQSRLDRRREQFRRSLQQPTGFPNQE